MQLAKLYGAQVTGVDGPTKLDMLQSIGADHVVDYTGEDFTRSGAIYDVIFDVIGKSPFARCIKSLSPGGRYVLANPRLHTMARGLWTSLRGSKKVLFEFASYRVEDMIFLRELIEAGQLRSIIDKIFPLEEAAEAHRYVDEKLHQGNVVLSIAQ